MDSACHILSFFLGLPSFLGAKSYHLNTSYSTYILVVWRLIITLLLLAQLINNLCTNGADEYTNLNTTSYMAIWNIHNGIYERTYCLFIYKYEWRIVSIQYSRVQYPTLSKDCRGSFTCLGIGPSTWYLLL